MVRVLITTLGQSWQIIPELVGWTNPELVDLYRYHPQRQELDDLRTSYGIRPIQSLWIITTDDWNIVRNLRTIEQWCRQVAGDRLQVRVVRVQGIHDLSSLDHCRRMSEAIYQTVLHGLREAGTQEEIVLSLTGGRKTMGSDMQAAAAFFGCQALLHVVGQDSVMKELRNLALEDWCRPLPEPLAGGVTPVVVGRHEPSPLWQYADDQNIQDLVSASGWITAASAPSWTEYLVVVQNTPVRDFVEGQVASASNLAANFSWRITQEDVLTNFLALYSLPPRKIHELKEMRLGVDPKAEDQELALLQRLPKAELHCHLGGALHVREMIEVARAVEPEIAQYQDRLDPWLQQWRLRLEREDLERLGREVDWKSVRRPVPGVPEPLAVAAFLLLFASCPQELERMMYGRYLDENAFWGIGFSEYERLGDLQGSALLQCEATLRAACRILGQKARDHTVLHLEVRCSPQNYTHAGLSPDQVLAIIAEELSIHGPESTVLLLIGSRHRALKDVEQNVALAQRFLDSDAATASMLVGFDLAGDEAALAPEAVRHAFLPLMERCLHATIHAGEIADASSIWQAVYHLSAERIGHGLTLAEYPALMERFQERRIALEMCPSSNCQIVGFWDAHVPGTASLRAYPLQRYLTQGLRVTINTDNPGISRTDFSREYHRASRLTPGGLSLWQILLLIRNSFKAAFTAKPSMRQHLVRQAEERILCEIERGVAGSLFVGNL